MTRYKFNTSVIEALSKEHLDNKNVTEVGIGATMVKRTAAYVATKK